ncbi:MAG: MATE family efflux transporter, partial [Muribaculaceae bacterium]|nr:MATE family efflux transporter [Muribaculaceae bacterium]
MVNAFCTLIAAGGATISSIYLGQQKTAKATATVNNVMLLCLINSIVFGSVALVFLDPILRLFGSTDATITYAREFMRIILSGTIVTHIYMSLNDM